MIIGPLSRKVMIQRKKKFCDILLFSYLLVVDGKGYSNPKTKKKLILSQSSPMLVNPPHVAPLSPPPPAVVRSQNTPEDYARGRCRLSSLFKSNHSTVCFEWRGGVSGEGAGVRLSLTDVM